MTETLNKEQQELRDRVAALEKQLAATSLLVLHTAWQKGIYKENECIRKLINISVNNSSTIKSLMRKSFEEVSTFVKRDLIDRY